MAEPAVWSRLFGGLGNQFFQYAAGRALADRLGGDLVLDPRDTAPPRQRGCCFAHFARARFRRDAPLPPARSDGFARYALWRAFGRQPRFVRERGLGFDPAFFALPAGCYLHGYWQSEKYFAAIARQIRADLALTTPLDAANAAMAARIARAETPVAVHVRRGDYLGSGAHGACPPGYYARAAARLAEIAGGPLACFVFSDDPAWARANLDLGRQTVTVDINDAAGAHFDLYLQTLCAHHIIANSTFSWWGAWLNPAPGKQVIAPRRWFADGRLCNPDICPGTWHRL